MIITSCLLSATSRRALVVGDEGPPAGGHLPPRSHHSSSLLRLCGEASMTTMPPLATPLESAVETSKPNDKVAWRI